VEESGTLKLPGPYPNAAAALSANVLFPAETMQTREIVIGAIL